MKSNPFLGLAAGALIGLAVSAHADTYKYSDILKLPGSNGEQITTKGISGTFDLLADGRPTDSYTISGYGLPTPEIYSDRFGLKTGRDTAYTGSITFFVHNSDTKNPASFTYSLKDLVGNLLDSGPGAIDKKTFSITNGDITGDVNVLAQITSTGKLDFTLTLTPTATTRSTTLYLNYAYLEVTAVPDGATTIILLGGSLCGIGLIRRKLTV